MPGTIFLARFKIIPMLSMIFLMLFLLPSCGWSKKVSVGQKSAQSDAIDDAAYCNSNGGGTNSMSAARTRKLASEYKCSDNEMYDALSCEARLTDIPVPLGTCPLSGYFGTEENDSDCGLVLGYVSQLDLEALLRFYKREMSYFGWQSVAVIDGNETLLVFEKPDRICSISLRPFEMRKDCGCMQLVLSIGEKEIRDISNQC